MRVLSTMIAAGVQGVVYDRSHAVVPDAEVMLVNNATGFRRSVNTPADGDYIFTSLHKADSRHHRSAANNMVRRNPNPIYAQPKF